MTEAEHVNIDAMEGWVRTHDCGALRRGHIGQEVILMGWVNHRRDLGHLIFIDLRDREGITQVVLDPQEAEAVHARARVLRNEWVLAVKGTVAPRLEGQENPGMPTGDIELKAARIKILNVTETPPFQVDGAVDAAETLRMKYRYLELRRPEPFGNLRKRHQIASGIRRYLDQEGFVEVETPFLTKSTPEGARDYLVPSRVNKGMFYALPQSPQLFKQLLMISGFDRYYQLVRCFRDEDLRADRQPEFTQVDLEMSFVDEARVMAVFEGMMHTLFQDILGKEVSLPIPRLTYKEAMEGFGTDRPDLRFGMTLTDITPIAGDSDFKVFREVIRSGGVVKAIRVRGGADAYSRKGLDGLAEGVTQAGGKGLAWVKRTQSGWQSSLTKFFTEEAQSALNRQMDAQPGDLVLMVADQPHIADPALGNLRIRVAREQGMIPRDQYAFVWITEFPLVEYDPDEGRLVAVHHPFTAPLREDLPLLDQHPEQVRARSYDLVLNGSEIGGGSIRIHTLATQQKIFKTLGIPLEQAESKFGFLLEALRYGAPPHGGMALGFDRLVAMMTGVDSIREIIAFPKTTRGTCPLTEAPSAVSETQLKELGLKLTKAARPH
ncbi:MAG: aspartate--tRNA ligase [Deltaproteobacteria bacterium]|nr:aspartate--tRNA ligase [Deltaproteobacteria bacterium]